MRPDPLAAINGPVASAEPFAPPEVPPGGVVFTDNPAIVDPHPIRVESWSRAADANAVAVNFTTGTDTCYGVHATVEETPDTVTVDLQGGTLPEAVNRAVHHDRALRHARRAVAVAARGPPCPQRFVSTLDKHA